MSGVGAEKRWRVRLPPGIERPTDVEAHVGEIDEVPSTDPAPAPFTVEWQIAQRGEGPRRLKAAWRSDDPSHRRAARIIVLGCLGAPLILIVLAAVASWIG